MAKAKLYQPYGFGERLNLEMNKRDMTAVSLGKAIGCERKCIYSWQDGETAPNIVYLMRICNLFNVSADYMLFGRS